MYEDDEPTETQIEEMEIERQIEYQEEALRGEHGEKAQLKAQGQVAAARHARLEQQEQQERSTYLHKTLGCPSLVKACEDDFDYALKLRSGEVIRFRSATYHDNGWISLFGIHDSDQPEEAGVRTLPYRESCDRGVDVRVDEILWVMDAPESS